MNEHAEHADRFAPVLRVRSTLAGFDRPWMVAGGWAIDLFAGSPARDHKDVDIAIFRRDQLALQEHLRGWQFYTAVSGKLYPWGQCENIEEPVHCIWAWKPGVPAGDVGLHPDAEFLLNERTATHWVYRRDPRVTYPLSVACLTTPAGIPYLAPEIVLLYKSRGTRETDEVDLDAALGLMRDEQRGWLRDALALSAPGHTWLSKL